MVEFCQDGMKENLYGKAPGNQLSLSGVPYIECQGCSWFVLQCDHKTYSCNGMLSQITRNVITNRMLPRMYMLFAIENHSQLGIERPFIYATFLMDYCR